MALDLDWSLCQARSTERYTTGMCMVAKNYYGLIFDDPWEEACNDLSASNNSSPVQQHSSPVQRFDNELFQNVSQKRETQLLQADLRSREQKREEERVKREKEERVKREEEERKNKEAEVDQRMMEIREKARRERLASTKEAQRRLDEHVLLSAEFGALDDGSNNSLMSGLDWNSL